MAGSQAEQPLERVSRFISVISTIINRYVSVALLMLGSAILLISCDQGVDNDPQDLKTLMTQQSDTLTIISSENGMKAYRFYAPLMERYEFASEPYMEFRRGEVGS